MRKIKLSLLLSSLFLAGLAPAFSAPPVAGPARAYDLLADLVYVPAAEISVSTPAAVETGLRQYENPPCVPSQALAPGKTFSPKVSDERRDRAIKDLLARIAVCSPMPYDNDGNVHSKPHAGLPKKPAGYYLEYTLIVPNRPAGSGPEPVVIGGVTYTAGPVLSFRGAERLMIGGGREVFYTPDHYTTFIPLSIVR
ncbi:MAG: ribonuclease domain-containing protein [Elusimicrobiales bacterium]|nr:ribonuclease domain-containing protein [Elusimicrobiales bacterium]